MLDYHVFVIIPRALLTVSNLFAMETLRFIETRYSLSYPWTLGEIEYEFTRTFIDCICANNVTLKRSLRVTDSIPRTIIFSYVYNKRRLPRYLFIDVPDSPLRGKSKHEMVVPGR